MKKSKAKALDASDAYIHNMAQEVRGLDCVRKVTAAIEAAKACRLDSPTRFADFEVHLEEQHWLFEVKARAACAGLSPQFWRLADALMATGESTSLPEWIEYAWEVRDEQ